MNFEVVLFEESNDLLFQYKDVSAGICSSGMKTDGTSFIGIEGPEGVERCRYLSDKNGLLPGLAIHFKMDHIQPIFTTPVPEFPTLAVPQTYCLA